MLGSLETAEGRCSGWGLMLGLTLGLSRCLRGAAASLLRNRLRPSCQAGMGVGVRAAGEREREREMRGKGEGEGEEDDSSLQGMQCVSSDACAAMRVYSLLECCWTLGSVVLPASSASRTLHMSKPVRAASSDRQSTCT